MPLILTITDAGRAALIDAQNTGSTALTIAEIGVSDQAIPGDLTQLVTLPAELKRLDTFAGDVVADDTFHVTMRDESADTYQLRAFGLYFHTGVLFCVCSQAEAIVEKSPAAMALLAVDIKLAELTTELIEFGDTNFLNPAATTDRPGVIEIATAAETSAGVDHARAVTPWGLKQLLDYIVAGLAPLVHVHDASHTTTGVFNVGRIPALDMSKITGLAVALAGKVSTALQIIAGDGLTGGGALSGSRTISLGAPATVSGTSTNAVAADGHSHALDLAIDDIPQLRNQLNARAGYRSDVDDWNQQLGTGLSWGTNTAEGQPAGSVAVVHIERTADRRAQLAMSTFSIPRAWLRSQGGGGLSDWAEVWTTANFDPASKADLAGADFGQNPVRANLTHTGGYLDVRAYSPDYDDGSYVRMMWDGLSSRYNFSRVGAGPALRLWIQGRGYIHDDTSFDPASKLNKAGDTLGGVLDASSWLRPEIPVPADPDSVAGWPLNCIAYARMDAAQSGLQPINGALLTVSRTQDRGFQMAVNANGDTYVRSMHGSHAGGLSPWGYVWTSTNFTPASKADLASPALTGNPTAPTQGAGDNSTRLANTAYADRAAQLAAEAALPPGTVAHYAAAAAPPGWLPCNGAAVSRSSYSALFARIGTTHGPGNGSSTFNVPDLRGEFIRGLDSGRGVDAGRVIGSSQADEFRSHTHGLSSHNGGFTEMESLTDTAGDDERFSAANRTMAEGGPETRPRNVALLACIKF